MISEERSRNRLQHHDRTELSQTDQLTTPLDDPTSVPPASQEYTTPVQTLPKPHDASAAEMAPVDHIFAALAVDDVPPAAADPSSPFLSYVDEISGKNISGWVYDPTAPDAHCLVVVKEGDQVLARTVASRFRADLAAAGIGDGCHSFEIATPLSLLDGSDHYIDLFEEQTSYLLTPAPLHWRSDQSAVNATINNADRMDGSRLRNITQQTTAAPRLRALAPDDIDIHHGTMQGDEEFLPVDRIPVLRELHTGTQILFDISDLVYYIGHHANLSGIQRVQSSIILSIFDNSSIDKKNITLLSFNARRRSWVANPTGFVASLLKDLFLPPSQRLIQFPAEEARYGLLPGARDFDGIGVLDNGYASVLCLLGAAWVNQDYLHRVLRLKRQFGTRFVMTIHDLIPIYARETCDQDTARVFEDFIRRALRHTDQILAVSENTANDIRRYMKSLKIPDRPITVTLNGSSFAEFLPSRTGTENLRLDEIPKRFVLFVATIEGRKNHQLMLDIWQRMLADGDDPPHLVCVGRLGWKSTAFINTLVETGYLDGRVILLRDISDTDLQALYARCLFTVCPTFYEGWGLPVGEALAMGKICVCSDRASIPEVAGEFGIYIDIGNFEESLSTIRALIKNPAARRRQETKIRRGYKPISWRSVSERVVAACLAAPDTEWQSPYPYTGIPYSTEISFGRLDRNADGVGDALLDRISQMRRGLFLGEPLHEQSFIWGEEARSDGVWAYPEEWGTWACETGAELALGLSPNDSSRYYVFLRVRASAPVAEQLIEMSANGEPVWKGTIGSRSRDIMLRINRRTLDSTSDWRLRIRARIALTAELRTRLSTLDNRIPTVGFERLIVVPANDIKARLDILYTLLL